MQYNNRHQFTNSNLQNNPRFSQNNPLESVQEHSIESDNTFRLSQERFGNLDNILHNKLNSGGKVGSSAGKNEKSPSKYDKKGLNQTFLSKIEGLSKDDIVKICMDERIKQENLQNKLLQKEKLVGQMRSFHNEICAAFEDAQAELQRVKEQRGVMKEKEIEIEKLKIKFLDVEKIQENQEKENKELKNQIQEKNLLLQQIRDENIKFEGENDYQKKKLENLENKCLALERENNNLRGFQQDESQIILDYKFKVDQLEEDNATMSIKIEENERDMKIILEERQELLRKLEEYDIALESSEKSANLRIEDALRDCIKINEEKLNNALIDQQYKYHQKEQKHKKQITKLSQQVALLENELEGFKGNQGNLNKQMSSSNLQNNNNFKSQTLSQQLKHSQMRISNLEQALQEVTSNYNQNDIKENALDSDNLVQALFKDFQPQNLTDLYNQIKEQKKLSECLQSMVLNCHPKGFFAQEKSQVPSLKQSWKWLKKILEEYMYIKKGNSQSQQNLVSQGSYQSPRFNSGQQQQIEGSQSFVQRNNSNNNSILINRENEEILGKVQEYLKVEKRSQILSTLADVLIEKEIANRLFQKLKKELGCEWVKSYEEFEETLNRQPSQNQSQNQQQFESQNQDQNNNDINDNNNNQQQQQFEQFENQNQNENENEVFYDNQQQQLQEEQFQDDNNNNLQEQSDQQENEQIQDQEQEQDEQNEQQQQIQNEDQEKGSSYDENENENEDNKQQQEQ